MPTPSRLLAAISSRAAVGFAISVCALAGGTGAVLHASPTDATISGSVGASASPSPEPGTSGTSSSTTSTDSSTTADSSSSSSASSSDSSSSASTTSIVEGPIGSTSDGSSTTSSDSSSTTSVVEAPVGSTTEGGSSSTTSSTTSDWTSDDHGKDVHQGVVDCKSHRPTGDGKQGIGHCVSAIADGSHGGH